MKTTIVVIGAGSARFILDMIRDICLYPGLCGSNIVFDDIDEEKLQWVTQIAQRYTRELNINISFTAEPDRRIALQDAQFVISTALAGGRDLIEKNRKLQMECGYYRGLCVHAPHQQLQLMVDVAKDIKEICPDAILLQCANPLPEGCTLAYRETGVNIVGICHNISAYRQLLAMLRMDPNKGECLAVGINHCIWALKFLYEGNDLYPKLRQWSQCDHSDFYSIWDGEEADYQTSKVTWDLFRLYDLVPIGDTCRASNPETWWYHLNEETQKKWWGHTGGRDCALGHNSTLAWLRDSMDRIRDVAQERDISVVQSFGQHMSEWQIVPIIDALLNNRNSIQQVNIPNKGFIAGLPEGFYVEVPALVNSDGIRPLDSYELPELVFQGAILPRYRLAEQIILAYQTGDIRYLLQAYLNDNKTRSFEQAASTLYALLNAPWNTSMREHYSKSMNILIK